MASLVDGGFLERRVGKRTFIINVELQSDGAVENSKLKQFSCWCQQRFGAFPQAGESKQDETWLILPVVICLSQRLSHACLSISFYTAKLRMAH